MYAEAKEVKICVYDPSGANGDLFQMMKEYKAWETDVHKSFIGEEYGTYSLNKLKQQWPEKRKNK